MSDFTIRTTCRLCGSANLTEVLNLGETPLANELDGSELFPLVMNRCDDCEHHQLSIAVGESRLWGPSYPYQSGTSPVFKAHLEKLADEVGQLVKPGATVFEIGSNDGTLCRMLSASGLRAKGTDPSGPVESTDTPYLRLWREPWPRPETVNGMSCILALNVFAHVDDLNAFTSAVKQALAPGGTFIVEVGYLLDVIERGHFDTIYHEHLSYHHVRPLAAFFERHGLRIEKVQHIDSQGGSIRVYVRHADEVPWYDAKGEDVPDVRILRAMIDTRAPAMVEAFGKLTKRDERICGYGAPAKLTTFTYALGLQELPLDCIGEDNPLKVGRATPGTHVPIVSVSEMLERKPDTIIVFAWNFFDAIRDKLRALGFKGGIIDPIGSGSHDWQGTVTL